MSRNTKKYILTGLGLSAGTFAAAFGIREGVRWWRERSQGRYEMMGDTGYMGYRSTLEPMQREAIPTTGAQAAPQATTGAMQHTMPERMPQAKPQDAPGTKPPGAPMTMPPAVPHARPEAMEPASAPGISETTPYGRDRDHDRNRDSARDHDHDQAQESPRRAASISDTSINMDTLVGPLIDYLIAFNSIMNVLRSQQLSSTEEEEQTLGERQGMRNVLEQVQDRLPHYEEGKLKSGSLEDRTYRLAAKIRDALSNMSNTDSDFLRLYDEVQPEVCAVSQALQASGSVSITGLDQVSQMYECRQR